MIIWTGPLRAGVCVWGGGGGQGWIQHDLVGGCSGADCRVVLVMCAARPSTTVFEL